MKICIVSILNIKHMSLISIYTNFFRKYGIQYDIVYLDKYNQPEDIGAENIFRYSTEIKKEWSPFKKILRYIKFRNYAKKIIKKNEYDFVIVWRTETALLLIDFLLLRFKGKYCLNIRDYFFEENKILFLMHKLLIKNSKFSTISSEGFKVFLPKHNYFMVHSFNKSLVRENLNIYDSNLDSVEPFKICFIGSVRFLKTNKKFIKALGNDERFLLQYFGQGSEYLKKFADDRNIHNVEFVGSFEPAQTFNLLNGADVINNMFDQDLTAVKTLTSIRFYYALFLGLPILVNKGTYMERISKKVGNGFVIDYDNMDELGNQLYNWLKNLNRVELKKNSNEYLAEIEKNNEDFEKKLYDYFVI